MNASRLTITARSNANPYAFVRFVWSDDLTECNFVACGFDTGADEQAALDALMAVSAHEGADCDGWTVEVA